MFSVVRSTHISINSIGSRAFQVATAKVRECWYHYLKCIMFSDSFYVYYEILDRDPFPDEFSTSIPSNETGRPNKHYFSTQFKNTDQIG